MSVFLSDEKSSLEPDDDGLVSSQPEELDCAGHWPVSSLLVELTTLTMKMSVLITGMDLVRSSSAD